MELFKWQKNYLSIVNELLVEINEPELTGVASAVGIQKTSKQLC